MGDNVYHNTEGQSDRFISDPSQVVVQFRLRWRLVIFLMLTLVNIV